jgi:AhpD family alkylhydroperoxidase
MATRQENLSDIAQAFGFIPQWLSDMPDAVLDQYWSNHAWVCSDTALTGREKALIAFGAAAAIRCEYRTPFHTAQLTLFGLDSEQIKEAGWVAQNVAGTSTYLHGIRYKQDKFMEELESLVEYRKKSHET